MEHQTSFIEGSDGMVVKSGVQRRGPVPLTRHQRATLYFKAVRCIRELFKEVGFKQITTDSHSFFTAELGKFILDMTVKESETLCVAHVTSYPGYRYDSDNITAKVTHHQIGDHGEYVIQVGAVLPNLVSCKPIYVVIDKNSVDPLREVFMSALAAAKELIQLDPSTLLKIKEALLKRDIDKDFERFSADESIPQLSG